MKLRYLSEDDIGELHAAALSLDIDRGALLDGVNSVFTATIPVRPHPVAQLLTDLHALNGVDALTDGSTPLRTWLRNAIALAGPRKEAAIFRRYLSTPHKKSERQPADAAFTASRQASRGKSAPARRTQPPQARSRGADSDTGLQLTYEPPTPDLVAHFRRAGHTEALCRNAGNYGAYYLRESVLIPADDTITTVATIQELYAELQRSVIANQRDVWRIIKKWMTLIDRDSIIARAVALSLFDALDRRPVQVDTSKVGSSGLLRWYTGRLLLLTGNPAPLKTFSKLVAHPDESTSLNACDAVADLLKVVLRTGYIQTHRKASQQVVAGLENALRHSAPRTREVAFEAMLWVDHPRAVAALESAVVDGLVSRQFVQSAALTSADAPHKSVIETISIRANIPTTSPYYEHPGQARGRTR